MTHLDAALVAEADAKRALMARIEEMERLLGDCRRAVELGIMPSVRWLPAKAASVVDAARIWDATTDAVISVRLEERGA